jgi:hypothetical protein
MKWFRHHRSGLSQVPTNAMEKVIFALLHMAKHNELTPTVIVWLCYALETLFDAPMSYNKAAVLNRSSALLDCNDSQKRILKKHYSRLYNIRSSLVHTGMNIVHPMHIEALDDKVYDEYEKWTRSFNFGLRLLLVFVQKIIENGWAQPKFTNRIEITGEPL